MYGNLRSFAHTKFPKFTEKLRNPDRIKTKIISFGVETYPLEYRIVPNQNLRSVSVIVATLGERESLVASFESVKNNSIGLDLEIIVVAPKSVHARISKIMQELGIDNYILVTDSKKGIYPAMNKGIEESNKEYIVFLNDDDQLIKNALSKTFGLLAFDHSPDLIACNSLYHYTCCNYYNLTKAEKFLGSGILHGAMSTSHQSQIWKRTTLLELGGFRNEISQRCFMKKNLKISLASDFDLFVRAVSKGITYVNIDVNLSISSPNGASLTSWRVTYIELLQIVWHVYKPEFKWLLRVPILVFAIETFHRNSGWIHEH